MGVVRTHEENSFYNSKSIDMKQKIRYQFLATRGGYLIEELPITAKITRVKLVTEIIQELHVGETGEPVRAVPKPDTLFTGWSDGVKSNPRTVTGKRGDFPGVIIYANFMLKYTWWQRFLAWIWGRRDPKKWA